MSTKKLLVFEDGQIPYLADLDSLLAGAGGAWTELGSVSDDAVTELALPALAGHARYRIDVEATIAPHGSPAQFNLVLPDSTDMKSSGLWSINEFDGRWTGTPDLAWAEVKNGDKLSGSIYVKGGDVWFDGRFGLAGNNAGRLWMAGRIDGVVNLAGAKLVSEVAGRFVSVSATVFGGPASA